MIYELVMTVRSILAARLSILAGRLPILAVRLSILAGRVDVPLTYWTRAR